MKRVLIVDAANVVGSKPDGWWRDRAAAALRLHGALSRAPLDVDVILVLEGEAKQAISAGAHGGVLVVHAAAEGDDEIVAQARKALDDGSSVDVATSDRGLRERIVAVGAHPTSVSELRRHIAY